MVTDWHEGCGLERSGTITDSIGLDTDSASCAGEFGFGLRSLGCTREDQGCQAKTDGLNEKTAPSQELEAVFSLNLAEWTGLEPATPGVTGRYSNQLNYHSAVVQTIETWRLLGDSNPCNDRERVVS